MFIGPPDLEARKEILRIHTKGKPLEKNVDLDKLATKMANYTGAEIAAVCNEASGDAVDQGLCAQGVTDHVHGAFRQRESGSKISNRGQRGVGIGILDTECPQVRERLLVRRKMIGERRLVTHKQNFSYAGW